MLLASTSSCHVSKFWPWAIQELKNSGNQMFMSSQREITTDKIQEKKNYRECSNINSRVSVH